MTLHRDVDELHALADSTTWRDQTRLASDIPALHARISHVLPRVASSAARDRLLHDQERLATLQRVLVDRDAEHHAAARRDIRAGGLRGPRLLTWLAQHPPLARDLAVEQLLGIAHRPLVFQTLPAGAVDHVASGVTSILHAVVGIPVTPRDVFVDVGAGLGKAAMLVNLLTGARVEGIELQPALVDRARTCAKALGLQEVSFACADARDAELAAGDIFYMYLPFRGAILDDTLLRLREVATTKPVVLCTGSMERINEPWLRQRGSAVAIYEGTLVEREPGPASPLAEPARRLGLLPAGTA